MIALDGIRKPILPIFLALGAGGVLAPRSVAAHAGNAPTPHDLWATWTTDPWVLLPLAILITLYAAGFCKLMRISCQRRRYLWHLANFLGAVSFLFIALISPLDGLGESLFSAHMAQHMVLMLPAAFLLVLAAPLPVLLLGIPPPARCIVTKWTARSRIFRRIGGWLIQPWPAASVQMIILWSWHVPILFKAALTSDGVHALMHMSFFGAAILFWWSVLAAGLRPGVGSLSAAPPVFLTFKLSLILGIVLLLSSQPWYAEIYADAAAAWGTTALIDQQLAAVIMMAPGMLTYLPAAITLLAIWLVKLETSG